jgi:pimeloyl-ACP methyl ester carboxylesterase
LIADVMGSGGVRLHVQEWGSGESPAIVFLHGWSRSHLAWKYQFASELAKESWPVAFDPRGHGMSEAPLSASEYGSGDIWPYAFEWGELVRILGGFGRDGQVTPPA